MPVFFVLSGFVMVWSQRPGDSAQRFWRRRAARIVPNHLVVWVVAAVLVTSGEAPTVAQYVVSLLLLQSWVPIQDFTFAVNGVEWSLSTEVAFYAAFPLLAVLIARLEHRGRVRVAVALLAVVVASNVAAILFVDDADWLSTDTVQWLVWSVVAAPPVRLAEFLLGALLALEVLDGRRWDVGLRAAWASAAVAFAAILARPGWFDNQATVVVPVLLLIAAHAARDLDGRPTLLSRRTLVRLGEWSFAFYLVHQLVIKALEHRITPGSAPEAVLFALIALPLGLAAAAGLHTLVERPAERRLRGGGPPRVD